MFEISCSGKLLLLISSSCSKVIHINFAYVPKYGESKYSRVVSPSLSVPPSSYSSGTCVDYLWSPGSVLRLGGGGGGAVSPGDLTKFPPLCPEEFTQTQ